jgi:DNA-binding NarL/FixJ family response regulator
MGSAEAVSGKHRVTLQVVEEHPLAARALRSILRGFPGATFHSKAPVDLAAESPFVLVVDAGTLAVPLGKLLRSLRLEHPKASVIVLDKESSAEYHLELLFLGVVGFVAYGRVPDELPRAIRSVARGGVWMTADVVEAFGRQRRLLAGRRHRGSLTRREMTVLGLLRRGLCNKEIASALGVSVSTVKFHLTNIFAKTGFHDRLRAARSLAASDLPQRAAASATPNRASGLSQQPAR